MCRCHPTPDPKVRPTDVSTFETVMVREGCSRQVPESQSPTVIKKVAPLGPYRRVSSLVVPVGDFGASYRTSGYRCRPDPTPGLRWQKSRVIKQGFLLCRSGPRSVHTYPLSDLGAWCRTSRPPSLYFADNPLRPDRSEILVNVWSKRSVTLCLPPVPYLTYPVFSTLRVYYRSFHVQSLT